MERLIWHVLGQSKRRMVNQRLPRYVAWDVIQTDAENDTGELSLTIAPDHREYSMLQTMRSELVVEDDGVEIWRGRVINQRRLKGGAKEITCKGLLDYFHDSSLPPHLLQGSAETVLSALIQTHNTSGVEKNKRFTPGIVRGIGDIEHEISRRTNTWKILKELVQEYGGALFPRRVGDVTYVDWLGDDLRYRRLCTQKIVMGENLLSLEAEEDGDGICTVMYGYGKETDGAALTVAAINSGKEYVVDENAVAEHGWIEDSVSDSAIEDPQVLLSHMRQELKDKLSGYRHLSANAVDLSDLGLAAERLEAGLYARLIDPQSEIDENVKVEKVKRYLYNPGKTEVEFGAESVTASKLIRRTRNDY